MNGHCAPDHAHDPIVARLVLDLYLCPDNDPITDLEDLPETIQDLAVTIPQLHASELSIVIGGTFAEGRTTHTGTQTMMQQVHPDQPTLTLLPDEEP